LIGSNPVDNPRRLVQCALEQGKRLLVFDHRLTLWGASDRAFAWVMSGLLGWLSKRQYRRRCCRALR
jgi:hypothetical protein